MARRLPTIDPDASSDVRDMAGLGKLVRNQRACNQLRIDDAAALCGVSADVLSRLENGKPVTLDKLMLILLGLGLHMVVLPARQAVALAPALKSISDQAISDQTEKPQCRSKARASSSHENAVNAGRVAIIGIILVTIPQETI